MLSHARLLTVLKYDKKSGKFTWKVKMGKRIKLGTTAGHLFNRGYIMIGIDTKRYLAHHLAWFYVTQKWPKEEIDHKDLNRSNNAWNNLREATHSNNTMNRKRFKNNKSGHTGVFFIKKTGQWKAYIKKDKIQKELGRFNSFEEAVKAYQTAATILFKQFKYGGISVTSSSL